MEKSRAKAYKIEINRILYSLSEGISLDKLSLDSYKYVKHVKWLESKEPDRKKIEAFYEEEENLYMEIIPWFEEEVLKGYVRFDYEESENNGRPLFYLMEGSLLILELMLLIVLFYLKYRLIRPFNRMSQLPYEMAKGHLAGEVKTEKSRFFGEFLWGLGQLKDRLDVTRKRSLELEREKKKMLLCLSHDMKTPLNTIKLYAKALEEGIYTDEGQKISAACQIGKKTAKMEQYVEEIVKTSREDILDIEITMGEYYLSDLVEKVKETYLEKCALHMVDLSIGTYENRLVKGDLDRTLEVFDNLFDNAFKYGDGRRIAITFYEEDYCQLIRMFNTGDSLTDQDLNHVFESFFRGANSEGKQGSGLGLYICREIMQKMDGGIFVQRELGGTAFVLVFR